MRTKGYPFYKGNIGKGVEWGARDAAAEEVETHLLSSAPTPHKVSECSLDRVAVRGYP